MLASEVMSLSRACLNDISAEQFTNDALLPYLQLAIEDLNLYLENDQTSNIKEESAVLAIPAGMTVINLNSTPPLPTDFRIPIRLEERPTGSTTPFVEMDEEEWEPEDEQQSNLGVWTFRESEIKLRGATEDVDLKISYFKSLGTITSANSVIVDTRVQNPLAYLTAAKACRYSAENYQRYNDLMRDYREARDLYVAVLVKQNQSDPIRRPGFREVQRSH